MTNVVMYGRPGLLLTLKILINDISRDFGAT
jgi:hypothetical protein